MGPQPTALEIRLVRVRDGLRLLDVKIERILSASSFVHGALLYATPTDGARGEPS
jgi:hypothetical protein